MLKHLARLLAIIACSGCSSGGQESPPAKGSLSQGSSASGAAAVAGPFLTETCDAYPTTFDVAKELRWVALSPLNNSSLPAFPAGVTLQTSSPPAESMVSAIEETLRLYDLDHDIWVEVEVTRDTSAGSTFLRWQVRPVDASLRGRFVLRAGPLPDDALFARGDFFVCHGLAESRFTVTP